MFPGGKGGRCVRLTTSPPSCTFVMKSGNLNFLELSGPLQACNGTALPLFYITILDMFRALTCPSSEGQNVLSQHLVSSLSVNGCMVCRMRADCEAVCSHPAYCSYREWWYQMLWEYNLSFWRWACWCSKHVEDCNVTYILLMNKGIVH
jgi:hypothetical protein